MGDLKLLEILKEDILEDSENEDLIMLSYHHDIFCECIERNFIETFKWLKETRPTEFEYELQTILKCAIDHGKEDFIEVIGYEHIIGELVYEISNVNILKRFLEVKSEKIDISNSIIFTKAVKQYKNNTQFEDIIMYVYNTLILQDSPLNKYRCFDGNIFNAIGAILEKKTEKSEKTEANLRRLFDTLMHKKLVYKNSILKKCCNVSNLEFARYIYENWNEEGIKFQDEDIKMVKTREMLEWLYSVSDNKENFKENVVIRNLEIYEFALSLGIDIELEQLEELFLKACEEGNSEFAVFLSNKVEISSRELFDYCISKEFKEIAEIFYRPNYTLDDDSVMNLIAFGSFDMFKWCYEKGLIPNIKKLNFLISIFGQQFFEFFLSFPELQEESEFKFQIAILSVRLKNKEFLEKYLHEFDNKMKERLFRLCCFYNFFEGFKLLFNEEFLDRQMFFTIAVKNYNLRFVKIIYKMGGVEITKDHYIFEYKADKLFRWILQNMNYELKLELLPRIQKDFEESCKYGFISMMITFKDFGNITDEFANIMIVKSASIPTIKFLNQFFQITDENAKLCCRYNFNSSQLSGQLIEIFGLGIYFNSGKHAERKYYDDIKGYHY